MKSVLKTTAQIVAVLLMSVGCLHKEPDGYAIHGTIKGVDSGTVKLVKYNNNKSCRTLDSAVIRAGVFELKGNLDGPEMLGIRIMPGNIDFLIFAENREMTVNADTSGAERYDYTAYGKDKGSRLQKVEVKGSASQDAYDRFLNEPEQLRFRAFAAETAKRYEAEAHSGQKEKIRAGFEAAAKAFYAWQLKWIRENIAKHPDAVAVAYILTDYYQFNDSIPLQEMDALIGKFTGDAKRSVYYFNLSKEAEMRRKFLPGKVAPDFSLVRKDSTAFTLSSTWGKYVLLDFRSSWCKPCRDAVPHWKSVYKRYHDKGFEIIGVSGDSRWNDWIKAMEVEKMPWIQVIDEYPIKLKPARVGTLYRISVIPFYVLLDKEGEILVYSGDEKDVDVKLKEIFKM
ncbi:MAG TPA: TlpA disulfide reductase family protein [Pedobacter sp.]|uniref:TlpA disulfide reductase family protein n=1 Tax=Pedobacter sp. TaxID=1411316 RepID=UPI002C08F705|nr:TlpA disulfide reductase family protein [Pedobacter sp.]HMI05821.1 TlpA disulfide reductase family protein [Pedobacter sp.]